MHVGGESLIEIENSKTIIQSMIFWGAIVIFEIGLSMASFLLPYYILPLTGIVITLLLFIAIVGKKEFGYLLIIVALFTTSNVSLNFDTDWSVVADGLPPLLFLVFFTYISWSLSRVLLKEETDREKSLLEILLFIFMGWSMITLLWTPNLYHGLIQWIKLVSIFLILYLSVRMINSASILNLVIWTFIVMGLIDSLVVYSSVIFFESKMHYVEHFWGNLDLILSYGPRYDRGAGFSGPNPTATRLNLVIFLALGKVLITENRRMRNLLFLFLPIIGMAQLLTMSRGGLVALICGTTFFLFFAPRVKERFFRNLAFFFAIILFLYILIFSTGVLKSKLGYQRITSAVSPETAGVASLGQRFEFWRDGFNLYKETHGLGLGIGGFQHYLEPVPYAHSFYLSALFDLGIVGLSLLVLMILTVLMDSFTVVNKVKKEQAKIMALALFSGIIALLIHGLVDFSYMLPELWLLIGMLIGQGGLDNAYEDWY